MIVYLDFDGVQHPEIDGEPVPIEFAFCCLPRFEEIMRDFGDVKIVISSTWRHQFSLSELKKFFAEDISERIIGVTPTASTGVITGVREVEILLWLQQNAAADMTWIALDNKPWLFNEHRKNVVVCRSHQGLDEQSSVVLRDALSSIGCWPHRP